MVTKKLIKLAYPLLYLVFNCAFFVSCHSQTNSNILPITVNNSTLMDGCFASGFNGRNVLFTVSLGKPAHLLGFDINAHKLIYDIRFNSLEGSWSLVYSKGILYIAGTDGHLYSFSSKNDKDVLDLGSPFKGSSSLFCLATTTNGEIYGGGYPTSKLFKYSEGVGFRLLENSPNVKNEKYIRSIQFNSEQNSLYLGIGAHAHLIKYYLSSNKFNNLLDPRYKNFSFVYDLKLVNGVLFSRVTKDGENAFINYNTRNGDLAKEAFNVSVKSIVWSNKEKCFVGVGKGYIGRFALSDLSDFKRIGNKRITSIIYAFMYNDQYFLLTNKGDLFVTQLNSNVTKEVQMNFTSQSLRIRSVSVNPHGEILTSGLIGGGIAKYSPKTNSNIQLGNIGQIEAVGYCGKYTLFGVYPHCQLYLYDSTLKWEKSKNPKLIVEERSQSRPISILGLPRENLFVIGTIPEYGKVGGALLMFNLHEKKLVKFPNLIKNQSIISFASDKNGNVYGGTSVYGGLGSNPLEKSAKLFEWDPVNKRLLKEIVISEGVQNIYGLKINTNGHIVGIADNKVFEFDPNSNKLIHIVTLVQIKSPIRDASGGNLIITKDGDIFANILNKLYKLDSETLKPELVMKDVKNLVYDNVKNKLIMVKNNKVIDYKL